MITLAKRRREQERQKRLEDAFREADVNSSGKITAEQMVKLYAAADCTVPNLEEECRKLAGREGEIKFGDFIRFSQGTELCKAEFHDRVFHKVEVDDSSAKGGKKDSTKKTKVEAASKIDKVEHAFRKFDTNKDGFLSREEFDEMMKDVDKEQASRIFRSCDQAGDGRISLEEFRRVLQKGKQPSPEQQPKTS